MPFEFGQPLFLWVGAVALWLTFRWAKNSMSGMSLSRHRLALWLRVVLIIMITLSLADLRLRWQNRDLAVLFVADLSASMPRDKVEQALQSYAERAQHLRSTDQTGLIVFGKDAGVEKLPSVKGLGTPDAVAEIYSEIDKEGTDIAAALRLADATFQVTAANSGRRVILISDGNANRGDELLEARRLSLSGAVVDVLPIDYQHQRETLIDSLLVPPEVHPEEPFEVVAIVRSEVDTEGRVQLYEDNELIATQEVELVRGKTRVVFPLVRRGKSRLRYEARLLVSDGDDTIVANNMGHAFTLVRGNARALIVGDPKEQEHLLQALDTARIVYEVVPPTAIPMNPEDYFLYDVVVFANVAAFEVGADAMRLIHGVVKNLGVGFIMTGGPNAFGAGGYRGTPIERLLPVEMDVKQREVIPNGALAMILHTCEFGNGNMWAKRIACIAVEALSPEDYVGVLLWDGMGQDRWGVPLRKADDKVGITNTINGLQPADMPSFAPSMALALQGLLTVPAVTKHMVIISDGDPAQPFGGTITGLKDAGVSVSTVCINPHGGRDTGTMKKIAADTGGKYYFVDDARKLPQIFATEALQVRRNLIMEEPFTPKIQQVVDAIRGIEVGGFPTLRGYVITTPKALAETSLVSHQDDPVLSQWRYGLAKTAAFTSSTDTRWGSEWVGWPGYHTFWAQLFRDMARRGTGEIFRIERTVDGERGTITLDAIDPDGNFIDALEVEGRVLDPKFDEQSVVFRQTGPGRYEGSFNANRSGSYLMSLSYRGDGIEGVSQTGLNVSYSPEYRQLQGDAERLGRLAASTGGRVLKLEDDPFDRSFPASVTRTPLWQESLKALLLLFFLDILLRRVRISIPVAWMRRVFARSKQALPEMATVTGGALSAVREKRAQQQGARRELQTLDAAGSSDDRDAEAASSAASSATSSASSKPSTPEAAPEESFTDRLLRAKRDARKKR